MYDAQHEQKGGALNLHALVCIGAVYSAVVPYDKLQKRACGLLKQQKGLKHNLRELLKDEARNDRMFREFNGICMDFSRQLIDQQGLDALLELSRERRVLEQAKAMAAGEKINTTEGRSVLHFALRAPKGQTLRVGGEDVVAEVHKVLHRIKEFADSIRNGTLRGATGKPLKNAICVGIGGSYLGSEFLVESLKTDASAAKQSEGRTIRFLANVDPIDVSRATAGLRPEETLVIIISKTFTTAETMLNARALKQWLREGIHVEEEALGKHLCAVSTNLKLSSEFGIAEERVFGFWDWVGGRFSVTSAVGVLPLAIHFGFDVVESILKGCHDMDNHFLQAPPEKNLPLLLGLISVYNSSVLQLNCVAVLPYCQAMHRFAAHIQQLTMESNGKGVDLSGKPLAGPAGEIYFGEPGTNGQHRCVPINEEVSNHDELMSNFFAQPDALAFGKTQEELQQEGVPQELIPHKTFGGNRPSTLLLVPECNAYYLGMLLSLYENRVATEGFVWGINSFDQWGCCAACVGVWEREGEGKHRADVAFCDVFGDCSVELGKVLAKDIRKVLSAARHGKQPDVSRLCCPTQRLLKYYLSSKELPLACLHTPELHVYANMFYAPSNVAAANKMVATSATTYRICEPVQGLSDDCGPSFSHKEGPLREIASTSESLPKDACETGTFDVQERKEEASANGVIALVKERKKEATANGVIALVKVQRTYWHALHKAICPTGAWRSPEVQTPLSLSESMRYIEHADLDRQCV
ncbi:glucose-6-phosphate isomerase [Cyclospora cayetanensis]|uniref:Glucose-6-phosphate isomerase n=1 Tax=Cyclospora cayetanensis TaxID=88456 RepID=A0A1D3CWK0_9EIME|nr:glucose-6-phosphate isomerase [Cyclospora cayetanensis]